MPSFARASQRGRFGRWWRLALPTALIGGPALALGMPDTVRIPIARPHPTGDPPDAALFSHWRHDDYTCVSCHPSTFPERRVGFTHDDMAAGRFCGSCHDGRTAFGPKEKGVECESCHVATSEKPAIDPDELW